MTKSPPLWKIRRSAREECTPFKKSQKHQSYSHIWTRNTNRSPIEIYNAKPHVSRNSKGTTVNIKLQTRDNKTFETTSEDSFYLCTSVIQCKKLRETKIGFDKSNTPITKWECYDRLLAVLLPVDIGMHCAVQVQRSADVYNNHRNKLGQSC